MLGTFLLFHGFFKMTPNCWKPVKQESSGECLSYLAIAPMTCNPSTGLAGDHGAQHNVASGRKKTHLFRVSNEEMKV